MHHPETIPEYLGVCASGRGDQTEFIVNLGVPAGNPAYDVGPVIQAGVPKKHIRGTFRLFNQPYAVQRSADE